MPRQFIRFQSSTAYKSTVSLLKTDLKTAMKEKNALKKDTVKGLLSLIKNKEIDTKESQHTEFLLYELFSKAISQRRDSIKEYTELKRPELAQKEQDEIEVIQGYLKQLPVASEEEVQAKVTELLEKLNAKDLKLNQIFKQVPWDTVKNEWKASESSVRAAIVKQMKK